MLSKAIPAPAVEPVSLAITYDESCTFEHPVLQAAFAYWRKLCAGRSMPARRDINPPEMRSFIANISLTDITIVADGTAQYFVRLAGTDIERVLGRRSGKPLLEGIPCDQTSRWLEPHERVRLSAKPVRGFGRLAFASKSWLRAEYLHAPLGDDETPTGIFGAFAATTTTEQYRF